MGRVTRPRTRTRPTSGAHRRTRRGRRLPTAEHSQSEHVLHLSTILHWHLRSRGHYHDAEILHHQALATARATGHPAGELDALTGLGHIHLRQGRYAQAADHFQQALRIARATGHRVGEQSA